MSARRAAAAASVVTLLALARAAAAQHCHVPDAVAPDPEAPAGHHAHHHHHAARARTWWLRASTTAVAGATDVLDEARAYQGVVIAAQAGWQRLSVHAAAPGYRVAGDGVGLGDLLAAATVDVLPATWPVRAGVTGSLSLPTGDDVRGRGMGHPMVAGGIWLRARRGRVLGSLGGVWARALGDGAEHIAHARGASGWPLVDPMNPSELLVDGSALVALVPARLLAGVGLTYAAPVELRGERRLVTSALTELVAGRYSVDVKLGVPVVGDPFVARATVELAYRY